MRTCRSSAPLFGPPTVDEQSARQSLAEEHAESIQSQAGQLLGLDNEYGRKLLAATEGLENLTLRNPEGDTPKANGHNGIQFIDMHTFKDAPNPAPDPPPGGWSNDPITRAAQKIAFGHAWKDHADDFPGMTRDQLAQQIENMFRTNVENQTA